MTASLSSLILLLAFDKPHAIASAAKRCVLFSWVSDVACVVSLSLAARRSRDVSCHARGSASAATSLHLLTSDPSPSGVHHQQTTPTRCRHCGERTDETTYIPRSTLVSDKCVCALSSSLLALTVRIHLSIDVDPRR